MSKNLVIILVEDNTYSQRRMTKYLQEIFPDCKIETLANGIQAINYLLSPTNAYDLVILDGKLRTLSTLVTSFHGPDVAEAMHHEGIDVPIVLYTKDPNMLARFDKVFGKRLPEIEKPCRKENMSVVLTPIVNQIKKAAIAADTDEPPGSAVNPSI